jgi:hypothetical protein
MLKKLLMTTAAAMIVGTMAQAQSGMADSILSQLQSQGYTRVEIKVGPTQIKAEAIKGTQKRELVYDRTTGQLLEEEVGTVDADDDTTPGVEVDYDDEDFIGGDDDDDSSDDDMDDDSEDDDNGSDDDDNGSDDDDNGSDDDDNGSDDDDNGSDDDNSGSGGGDNDNDNDNDN